MGKVPFRAAAAAAAAAAAPEGAGATTFPSNENLLPEDNAIYDQVSALSSSIDCSFPRSGKWKHGHGMPG